MGAFVAFVLIALYLPIFRWRYDSLRVRFEGQD
jgi:hypothetical protein